MRKCSKCEKVLPLTEFGKRRDSNLQSYCKRCNRSYQRRHYLRNKKKYIENKNKYKEIGKEYMQKVKATSRCEFCGESHIAVLDFHHKDHTTKSFSLSGCYGKSIATVQAEIDKCIVLCSNCHRKLHYSQS